jgi:putative transcriptional regulator
MDSMRGKLLVATPHLRDPNFARTVVAIANHDADGALGVILNRPSETPVADAVPDLADAVNDTEPVFVGGPVQPQSIVVLAEVDDPGDAALLICGRIGLVADKVGVDRLSVATGQRRVYAGYAGWGPGQLEDELSREDWITADTQPDDVFCVAPESLWSTVLDRMGGSYRLVARMPLDPSVN